MEALRRTRLDRSYPNGDSVLMAELAGETLAKSVQLGLEYAPAPPFASGRPELASPEIVAAVRARMEPLAGGRREAVAAMAARLEAAV